MANIYTIEDFEERLSELAIGTEDAQALTEFARRRVKQVDFLSCKLGLAETIIGEYELDQRMVELGHE